MTPLVVALVALCTIWVRHDGTPVLHKRVRALGGVVHLRRVAVNLESASELSGVPVHVLAALAHAESGLVPRATSSVGARGLLQLMPGTPHHREWRSICVLSPADCNAANLLIGARVLRRAWQVCGAGWANAVSKFRGAGCLPRPRDFDVQRSAERVRSHLDV